MYDFRFKAYDKKGDVVKQSNVVTVVERGADNNFFLKLYHVNGTPLSFKEVENEAN